MIRVAVKLRLNKGQSSEMDRWLWHLTGVYNWTLRQVELGLRDHRKPTVFDLISKVSGASKKVGVPAEIIEGTIKQAYRSWDRCLNGDARRPRMKGNRNRLSSVEVKGRLLRVVQGRVSWPSFRSGVRYFRQPGLGLTDALSQVAREALKGGRLLKRASGWYLSIIVDQEPAPIPAVAEGRVGIDLGYSSLATLSTGEKVEHPHEVDRGAKRIAQAQRGRRKALTDRARERQANRVKDRNHKLSRRIVAENAVIVVSRDNIRGLARCGFGRSVHGAAHAQLRAMLSYKCRAGGREYLEVDNRNSTRACSACGCLTGPHGRAGLKVRAWACSACGAEHDRDVNAAINTLMLGAGRAHESRASGARNGAMSPDVIPASTPEPRPTPPPKES